MEGQGGGREMKDNAMMGEVGMIAMHAQAGSRRERGKGTGWEMYTFLCVIRYLTFVFRVKCPRKEIRAAK